MIVLTYAEIRDPEFNPVLQRLVKARMPYKTAKRILDICSEIAEEQKKSDELWTNICERFMEPLPDNPSFLRLKETLTEDEEKEARSVVQEFYDTPVGIDELHLTPDELALVELSPLELSRIQGLITD